MVHQNCPGCGWTLEGVARYTPCHRCNTVHDKEIHAPGGQTWQSLHKTVSHELMSFQIVAMEAISGMVVQPKTTAAMEEVGHTLALGLLQALRKPREPKP